MSLVPPRRSARFRRAGTKVVQPGGYRSAHVTPIHPEAAMSSDGPQAGFYAEMRVVPAAFAGPAERVRPAGGLPQAPSCLRRFRPIVLGPTVLYRRRTDDRWRVQVSRDGTLLPLLAASESHLEAMLAERRRAGRFCRVAAALMSPGDTASAGVMPRRRRDGTAGQQPRLDTYGWALLYQPPGIEGLAFVDRHQDLPDLPACFELPLELLDRAAFLADRGFRTRPLAVVAHPEDFQSAGGDRLSPAGGLRPPSRLPVFWPATAFPTRGS